MHELELVYYLIAKRSFLEMELSNYTCRSTGNVVGYVADGFAHHMDIV